MFKVNRFKNLYSKTVRFCEDFFVFMYVFQPVMLKVASDLYLQIIML